MKFYESSDIQHELLIKESNAPVLKSLYTDPALLANPKLGYLKTLGESLRERQEPPGHAITRCHRGHRGERLCRDQGQQVGLPGLEGHAGGDQLRHERLTSGSGGPGP